MSVYDYIPAPFGPVYPKLAGLQKYRRWYKHGLADVEPSMRKAYGQAVEDAILALQRDELGRYVKPTIKPACASGTWHNTAEAIEAAVRAQQKAALAACPSRERRKRTPKQWQEMYDEAMQLKQQKQEAV